MIVDIHPTMEWFYEYVSNNQLPHQKKKLTQYFNNSSLDFSYKKLVQIGMFDFHQDKSEIKKFLITCEKKNVVEKIKMYLEKASKLLDEIKVNVVILPLNPYLVFYSEKMNGILAHTNNDNTIYFYIQNSDQTDLCSLEQICFHEYQHVVRNQFYKPKEKCLLDVLIDEGISENFIAKTFGDDYIGPWSSALSQEEINQYWNFYKDNFECKNINKINILLNGNRKEIPLWSGYSIGYYIVKNYLKHNSFVEFKEVTKLNAKHIYQKSYL